MSREAPRKITRAEKKQLAELRKAKPDATEADLYNIGRAYINWANQSEADREKTFWSGVEQARAIPMEAAAPIESRTSYAPGRALQGLIGRSSEAPTGIGMARSGAYGSPIPERTLRFGDNTFYPDYYRGEGEYSPAVIGQAIKDNPRLAAEATGLGILSEFGRVTGTGEGMQEFIKERGDGIIRKGTTMAMEGEFTKPASMIDYVSAGSWFVPGLGFTKPAVLAAKAGRAIGKAAMRSPKLAGAGAAGGAAAYGLSGGTEKAEAWPGLEVLKGLTQTADKSVARAANNRMTSQLRNRIRKDLNDLRREGGGKTRNIPKHWLGRALDRPRTGKGEVWDEQRDLIGEFVDFTYKNPTWESRAVKNPKTNEIVWGHVSDVDKADLSPDNLIMMTRRTNDEMNARGKNSVIDFIEDEMRRTGKTAEQVKDDWDLKHYTGQLPG